MKKRSDFISALKIYKMRCYFLCTTSNLKKSSIAAPVHILHRHKILLNVIQQKKSCGAAVLIYYMVDRISSNLKTKITQLKYLTVSCYTHTRYVFNLTTMCTLDIPSSIYPSIHSPSPPSPLPIHPPPFSTLPAS